MSSMNFVSAAFDKAAVARNETLFTVANGSLGFRGDFEEKAGTVHKGTYINGFFDSEPIVYGEGAYGYAENHQTIVNLPDPKRIDLEVNGQHFSIEQGCVSDFKMQLDFESGLMSRSLSWSAPDGTVILLHSERLVSFSHEGGAAIRYRVEVESGTASIRLQSMIDATVHNLSADEDPRVGSKFSSHPLTIKKLTASGATLNMSAQTRYSAMFCAASVRHAFTLQPAAASAGAESFVLQSLDGVPVSGQASVLWAGSLGKGQGLELTKYISYRAGSLKEISAEQLLEAVNAEAALLERTGWTALCQAQREYLASFWQTASIAIDGDPDSERALHFNLFHLLQSAGRNGKTSIAAKGLTAEGYEGHYFWDTEAYVCPVFTYLQTDVARGLLEYRYSILDKARERARVMSLRGALYPWRTIDGEETSAYYPAGTAQYHINADIIFALEKLLNCAGKTAFEPIRALEMAVETARMWMSLGSFTPSRENRFCINCVTGPDEYTAVVNNNAYTNLMARENLRFSIAMVEWQSREAFPWPAALAEVSAKELSEWRLAAERMYIPYDSSSGVYPQDDSFMDKAEWDFAGTPKDKYPLLLHFHPLVIYRHRVLKQPDLVLAQFLLSDEFTLAEKTRNFHFYERLTTGDSSLSHCIQNIMACEIGEPEKAWEYFNKTARMDIEDVHGNTRDGIHTAAMAGSWMSVVYGFAGFRDRRGQWSFNPCLPAQWNSLAFKLHLSGCRLAVRISKNDAEYELQSGKELSIRHRDQTVLLRHGETKAFSLLPVFRAVLFDLDGVITDTAELHYQAWKHVSDALALAFDRDINERLRGVSREESFAIILAHNNRTMSASERQKVLETKNNYYVSLLSFLSAKDILPGILPLLESLRGKGIKTALASASRNAVMVCQQLGIETLFDAIVDVAAVPMSKPEPDIFLRGAEMLGIWPSDCVAVEDAQAGIDAIKKAGMKAVGIGMLLTGAELTVPDSAHLSATVFESLFPVQVN